MAQLIVTFPDTLVAVLDRALVEHGSSIASDTLTNWLKDVARQQQEADARDIFAKLTLAEREQFKARTK